MKTAVIIVVIVLSGILAAAVAGRFIRGEDKAPAQQQPSMPLVHCHAQGGEMVDGKCQVRRRKS